MSEYEAKVYLALIRGGTQTMTELAETSGVPKQRVYDTVDELRDDGFVEVIDDYPQKAHAVDPSEALAPIQTKLSRAESYLDELHNTIDTVERGVTTFKSAPSIKKYVRKIIEEAEHDLFVLGPREILEQFREDLFERREELHIHVIVSGLDETYVDDETMTTDALSDVANHVRGITSAEDFAITGDRREGFYWSGSARRQAPSDEKGYYITNEDLAFVLDRFMSESLWPFALASDEQNDPEFPTEYLRLRDGLADLDRLSNVLPLDSYVVSFEGYDTETNEYVSMEGVPVSYYFNEYDIRTSLTLELDGDGGKQQVTVGGWGATKEDYEARKLAFAYRNGGPSLTLDDETRRHLERCRSELPERFGSGSVVVGFDAFIDRMREVVAERSGGSDYVPVRHFEEFTQSLSRVDASESALVEWTETRTEPGGHVAHAGRVFDNLGYDLTLVGPLGDPVSSVFARRFRDQTLVSVGDVTATDFVLLEDKKLLFTEPNWEVPTWESILDRVDAESLAEWTDGTRVLSIGSFYATGDLPAILDGFREEVWPMVASPPPAVHVSTGELHRLSAARIERVVESLEALDDVVPVTVTANRRAAKALGNHLSVRATSDSTAGLAAALDDAFEVSRVVVDSFEEAASARDGTVTAARKPMPDDPRERLDVSEHFETGMAVGLAEDLSDGGALVLANAVAFYFNQHKEFPTEPDLRELLEAYDTYFERESVLQA
jgi:sugar-specific transcriptional regulator TrmB